MKKYKYFAISENSSDRYYTKKEAFSDMKNFGDEYVELYKTMPFESGEYPELWSEDIIATFKKGKQLKETN